MSSDNQHPKDSAPFLNNLKSSRQNSLNSKTLQNRDEPRKESPASFGAGDSFGDFCASTQAPHNDTGFQTPIRINQIITQINETKADTIVILFPILVSDYVLTN